jgi:hypothetical protein
MIAVHVNEFISNTFANASSSPSRSTRNYETL